MSIEKRESGEVVDLACPLRMNRGIPQTFDWDDVDQEERLMRLRGLRVVSRKWVWRTLYYREFGDRIRNRRAGYLRHGFLRKLHGPCARIASVAARDEVQYYLSMVEPIDAEIIRLRYWDNMSLPEIAENIGLCQWHISRRIAQALRQLRTVAQVEAAE